MQFKLPRLLLICIIFLFFFLAPSATYATVLWSTDYEGGTLADWSLNSCGGEFDSGNGVSSVATTVAHSGIHAAKMTINATGTDTGTRLFRWCESRGSNDALYYSAWYYFPQQVSATGGWWNVFQFKSNYATGNDPYWLLDVDNRANGAMYLSLYDWIHAKGFTQTIKDIPVAKWTHVEAYLKRSTTTTGQITVWQDGVEIYNQANVATLLTNSELHWSINNYSASLTPSNVTIYTDDAAISTTRLSTAAVTTTPTIIPSPTLMLSPSPTPETTRLGLTLQLHGVGKGGDSTNPQSIGNTASLTPQRSVQVTLNNSQNVQVIQTGGAVVYNSQTGYFHGTIDVGTLPSGSYTARVATPTYLSYSFPGIITLSGGQINSLPSASLIAGDSNGDNQLNILDYNMILDCYADLTQPRACTDLAKKQATDLDDDGKVNQFDYNLFIREMSVRSGN